MLDSDRIAADHFRRDGGGAWSFTSYAAGDTITLHSVGLTCQIDAFYRRTSLNQSLP